MYEMHFLLMICALFHYCKESTQAYLPFINFCGSRAKIFVNFVHSTLLLTLEVYIDFLAHTYATSLKLIISTTLGLPTVA